MENKIILIIGLVWPEPNSSAAGKRMMQLISFFEKENYKVIFASTALENDYNFDLKTIEIEKKKIKLNSDCFDELIKEINPSIVLFDRFITEEQFGWRVVNNCPNALKILDSEDLHCLRYTRQTKTKKGLNFSIDDLFEEEYSKREIASILRCDLTLIIAEFEMQILTDYFKISPALLFYLPILFSEQELQEDILVDDFEQRKDFVFIGNFWHEPNWDAVLYLKKFIWPSIRKVLPKVNLRIYGAYPSQKVFDLNNKKEGFLVMGRAEEAQDVIKKARVLIAPLRFGAGIKGKLIEAMQFGTPTITTNIGAESIPGNYQWNGFIEDNPTEMANKAVFLYENKEIWTNAKINGKLILKNRFNQNEFEPTFIEKLKYLLANLTQHRRNNFIGTLLNYHTIRSTEYMSRWIQEKNK